MKTFKNFLDQDDTSVKQKEIKPNMAQIELEEINTDDGELLLPAEVDTSPEVQRNSNDGIQSIRMKRGRGRPRIIRTGSADKPLFTSVSDPDVSSDDDEFEGEEFEEDVFIDAQSTNLIVADDPLSWEEAATSSDAKTWEAAIDDEYLSQIKNKTWKIIDRPPDRKIVGNRFVLRTKRNIGLSSGKKKARLVAKAFSQRPGEDFHETFSPVVRATSIRILAALSAELGLEIHQMDATSAYLNGELHESLHGGTSTTYGNIGEDTGQETCWIK